MQQRAFKQPSPMTHDFSRVTTPQITRTAFSRNRSYKTTFNSAQLIPFFFDVMFPGETMSVQSRLNGRLSTLLNPIMDNIYMDTFFFKVPIRILWENWERFMGYRPSPNSSIDFICPKVEAGGDLLMWPELSLGDYFGLPTKVYYPPTGNYPNAFLFRAYNMIWNEWFRDQNLQTPQLVQTDDGPDNLNDYQILYRGKRHDRFTSSLPFAQKGEPVQLPLGLSAPVIGDGRALGLYAGGDTAGMIMGHVNGTGLQVGVLGIANSAVGDPVGQTTILPDTGWDSDGFVLGVTNNPALSGIYADLSEATAATINQLRMAFTVQQILERDARGGTRYPELMFAHFGQHTSDGRLQRPEYIGGSTSEMTTMMVPQMSSSTEDSPQGNLAAFGEFSTSPRWITSAEEHMVVIGLVNVRSDITYQQGQQSFWNWDTRYEWYLPSLANIGEQPVYNREIYFTDSLEYNNGVFGYNEAWNDLRSTINMVTGLFRSNADQSLDTWHLATDFGSAPVLNGSFIEDNPPIARVVVDQNQPQILLDTFSRVTHTRPLPPYSNPGLDKL